MAVQLKCAKICFMKWISETNHFCGPSTPKFLLGLKKDLRHDTRTDMELLKTNQKPVQRDQAEEVCRRIGAVKYFECSALTAEGVRETLYGIFSTALDNNPEMKSQGKEKSRKKVVRQAKKVVTKLSPG
ncbi:GTP-binding protein RHO1 [Hyaloscypha finlandica]|nr:GTP-binding protein RHO1 [Hyaloscypha finlandica]